MYLDREYFKANGQSIYYLCTWTLRLRVYTVLGFIGGSRFLSNALRDPLAGLSCVLSPKPPSPVRSPFFPRCRRVIRCSRPSWVSAAHKALENLVTAV